VKHLFCSRRPVGDAGFAADKCSHGRRGDRLQKRIATTL
jgi:hypothetical protein